MSAIATVLTAPQRLSELCDAALVRLVLDEQLDRDPQQQKPAHQPQPGQLEHVLQDHGEEDAQHDRRAGAEQNAPKPLAGRQSPAGQGDDDGVVT